MARFRCGEALLAGLFRCGHCGRKLHVAYSGTHSKVGRYHCRGSRIDHGGEPCISFGGLRVDAAISAEVIARLQPLRVQAALSAMEDRDREHAEKLSQLELALASAL
ncbi:zinc ribbon domain-containing protein [Bradyrhizobium australiense]|uniref:zinc ribbon domain-containing protein n=1 Tax=Bradyrhizobium australiense TaxID=2721161 RepID=UPI001AED703E|nr:zinc ribbon domain-containing protein [Bradyrhizobium australiense]